MHVSFTGYQSVPLKNLYLEENYCDEFIDELREVAKEENFGVKLTYDNDMWLQDSKTIIERNGKPYCIASSGVSNNFMQNMKCYDIQGEKTWGCLAGGDTFLGKFENGKKWLITGKKYGISKGSIERISELYNVPLENIFFISPPNFHLDMSLRPIDKNNVLVNDFDLVKKALPYLDDGSDEFSHYKQNTLNYIEYMKKNYSSADEICNELKSYGFNPIRVPGVWGSEVNFMNAIANQHNDGTFSYITNSSKCSISFYEKMEKYFEIYLKTKVPNVRKVYFIEGNNFKNPSVFNYMMNTLDNKNGGIHCMSLEEPNFEIWG